MREVRAGEGSGSLKRASSFQTVALKVLCLGNLHVGKSTLLSSLESGVEIGDLLKSDKLCLPTEGLDGYRIFADCLSSPFVQTVVNVLELSGDRENLISAGRVHGEFIDEAHCALFCVDVTNINSMASFGFFLKTIFFDLGRRQKLASLPFIIYATKVNLLADQSQLPKFIRTVSAYFSDYFEEQPVVVSCQPDQLLRLIISESRLPRVRMNYWTKWGGMGYYEFGENCLRDLGAWLQYLGLRVQAFYQYVTLDEADSPQQSKME